MSALTLGPRRCDSCWKGTNDRPTSPRLSFRPSDGNGHENPARPAVRGQREVQNECGCAYEYQTRSGTGETHQALQVQTRVRKMKPRDTQSLRNHRGLYFVVQEFVGIDRTNNSLWKCLCDCGATFIVRRNAISTGTQKSCGCRKVELSAPKPRHGHTSHTKQSVEYRAFYAARDRCNNPHNVSYRYYGARGIRFLFDSFEEFHQHLGPRPHPGMSVDRINTNGHYEVGNVRWATAHEQRMNQRRTSPAYAA